MIDGSVFSLKSSLLTIIRWGNLEYIYIWTEKNCYLETFGDEILL